MTRSHVLVHPSRSARSQWEAGPERLLGARAGCHLGPGAHAALPQGQLELPTGGRAAVLPLRGSHWLKPQAQMDLLCLPQAFQASDSSLHARSCTVLCH